MKLAALAAATLLAPAAFSQSAAPVYGCDSPEARQFDFWVGEWDLSYVENGKRGTSRNRVTKILDGCAILEEFRRCAGHAPQRPQRVHVRARAGGRPGWTTPPPTSTSPAGGRASA